MIDFKNYQKVCKKNKKKEAEASYQKMSFFNEGVKQ